MSDITLPTGEQEQRAKWDQLLTDIELKQEQLRQLRTIDYDSKLRQYRSEAWRLAFMGMTAGAALFGAGAAFIKIIGG